MAVPLSCRMGSRALSSHNVSLVCIWYCELLISSPDWLLGTGRWKHGFKFIFAIFFPLSASSSFLRLYRCVLSFLLDLTGVCSSLSSSAVFRQSSSFFQGASIPTSVAETLAALVCTICYLSWIETEKPNEKPNVVGKMVWGQALELRILIVIQ